MDRGGRRPGGPGPPYDSSTVYLQDNSELINHLVMTMTDLFMYVRVVQIKKKVSVREVYVHALNIMSVKVTLKIHISVLVLIL